MKRHKRRIVKTIVIILVAIILLEVTLRIIGTAIINAQYSQHIPPGGTINKTVILTLGESTTAGLWVNYSDSYPGQLEKRLQQNFPEKNIMVVMPLHVGQNTGQLANRIEDHITKYHPKIIIIMAGYNNEWSLAESNIGKFVQGKDSFKINVFVTLDQFRIFRVIRYLYLITTVDKKSTYYFQLNNEKYVWGGTELVRTPPSEEIYSFAEKHQHEFVELWNYDMHNIIATAKKYNVTVVLMTYHINPTYLSAYTFEEMARQERVILVRNDLTFNPLIENGLINNYVLPQDHWHPNGKGYQLIADNAYDAIVQNKLLN